MKLTLISPKGVGMGSEEKSIRTQKLYEKLEGIDTLRELMSCPNSPLLTIAAIAEEYFDMIEYIDEEIETIEIDGDYDIVAMSFMTQQATRAFELADYFRKRGIYLVAGGMHPTNSPNETGNWFDTVFIGEGEITWHEFMKDFIKGHPKKFYENKCEICMDDVPIPMFKLLIGKGYKTVPIQISRGCPHNCEFCASTKVYGAKYRHKCVSRVVEEVKQVHEIFGNSVQIYFTDDNMLVNEKYSIELLTSLKDLRIRWMTHTDIGVAEHDNVLNLLHESGCKKLVIGFESIEPKSLKMLEEWKFRKFAYYEEYIKKIQSHGVGIWGTFIVGLDSDDTSIFQKVVDFALKNHLYGAMISVPTPFPGSKLYERLEKEGRILSKCWADYTLWNVVVKPQNMTVEELERGFEYVLMTIYSHDNVIKRMNYFKHIYRELLKR